MRPLKLLFGIAALAAFFVSGCMAVEPVKEASHISQAKVQAPKSQPETGTAENPLFQCFERGGLNRVLARLGVRPFAFARFRGARMVFFINEQTRYVAGIFEHGRRRDMLCIVFEAINFRPFGGRQQ